MSGSALSRNALVVLAVIASGAAMYWLAAILTPLALAIFLMVMLDGFARLIRRWLPSPERAAMPLAIVIMLVAVGLTLWVVGDNAAGFANQLVNDAPRLNTVIAGVAEAVGVRVPPTVASLVDELNPTRYLGTLVLALQSFATGGLYALIYLGFLLASRAGFERKTRGLFPLAHERENATIVFKRIRDGMERYLWIQTVTGAAMAIGAWAAMALIGLQNAAFWAFLIFIASFIPVLGGIVGSLLPPLFALLQFEAYWRAAVLAVALQVIFFVVGNVVQPRMQRDSLNIDPVVVLLSLAFWGAIWSVPGMFLSTPLTVTAIIVLAQFPGSHWIAILLSGDGEPERGTRTEAVAPALLASPKRA